MLASLTACTIGMGIVEIMLVAPSHGKLIFHLDHARDDPARFEALTTPATVPLFMFSSTW